jgi:hypothetical protein
MLKTGIAGQYTRHTLGSPLITAKHGQQMNLFGSGQFNSAPATYPHFAATLLYRGKVFYGVVVGEDNGIKLLLYRPAGNSARRHVQ